jgi:formylglycine-generating enzyme required for sulfatase activity
VSRKEDLEQRIRASYSLLGEYEDAMRTLDRAEERSRTRRSVQAQRALLEGYLAEYRALIAVPDDIARIAARFWPLAQDTAAQGKVERKPGLAHTPARQPFEPEMVPIPGGEFWMGSDPQKDPHTVKNEEPQHILYLADYCIARTPVTNAQYLAFVLSAAYRPPKGWRGETPPQGREDHPVTHVFWRDGLAYCRWLASVTGKPYDLPGEAEWEKAARGTEEQIYPWGNAPPDKSLCNSDFHVRGTTPVGHHSPQGDSPYGCADMAGNVWEWTRSVLKPYPYNPADGREEGSADDDHVLRGGSFIDPPLFLRCAFRYAIRPADWIRLIGFRVVLSPGRNV